MYIYKKNKQVEFDDLGPRKCTYIMEIIMNKNHKNLGFYQINGQKMRKLRSYPDRGSDLHR